MGNVLIQNKRLEARQWAFDIALAVGVLAFCCAQVLLTSTVLVVRDEMFRSMVGYATTTPPTQVFLALALTALPLALRRISPWLVFTFVLIMFLGAQDAFRGYAISLAGPIVALFTIACERSRGEAIAAASIGVFAMFFASVPAESQGVASFFRVQNMTYLLAAALAGYALRVQRDYVAETERRAVEAERSREEEAVRRVAEERVRIARELHDITAHSLTAVSIQSAAAERLVDRDPAAAKEAMGTVRATAKGALDEIRSMIGVLRDDDGAETAPTQGTERMKDLVGYLREAGLDVTYEESGYDRNAVPKLIDVALYGIAREAATNIVRHSQAKAASIKLVGTESSVRLVVEDDGVGIAERSGGGHGLQGMEERVGLLNGAFTVRRRIGGGTVVSADIPAESRES